MISQSTKELIFLLIIVTLVRNYSANTAVCMRCKRKSVICTCYYLCFCAYSSSVELLLGLQQSVW